MLGCAARLGLVATLAVATGGLAQPAPASGSAPAPSERAKVVCSDEAKHDLTAALEVKPRQITKPTYVDSLYSCTYKYRTGAFTLSMKDLSLDAVQPYLDGLTATLGRSPTPTGVVGNSFKTSTGSLVIEKDNKVLLVDTSEMPNRFGKEKYNPSQVATIVGRTILECWKGVPT